MAVSKTWAAAASPASSLDSYSRKRVTLPDRGGRLQLVYRPRAGLEAEQTYAPGDRPRGDHDKALTVPAKSSRLRADRVQHLLAKAAVIRRDDRRTKLHYQVIWSQG